MNIKRGEIYLAALDPVMGREISAFAVLACSTADLGMGADTEHQAINKLIRLPSPSSKIRYNVESRMSHLPFSSREM
jgi:hypothetical protein